MNASPQLRDALDAIDDGVALTVPVRDRDGRIVDFRIEHLNVAAANVLHGTRDALTGHLLSQHLQSRRWPAVLDALTRVIDTGVAYSRTAASSERVFPEPAESRIYDTKVAKLGGGLIHWWRDVTERETANRQLRRSEAALAAAQRIARVGSWRVDLRTEEVTGSDELYQIFGFERPAAGRPRQLEPFRRLSHPDDLAMAVRARARALHDRRPFRVQLRLDVGGGQRTVIVRGEPVEDDNGELVAVQGTLQDVTDLHAAYEALRATEAQLAAERRIVAALQQDVLPARPPTVPGVDVAARYLPAAPELTVGGDWYDVVALPNGTLAVALGDVAGHGVEAASLMGQFRAAQRAYMIDGRGLSHVVSRLNRYVARFHPEEFATTLVATYDPAHRTLRWSRAGHPPPLLAWDDEAYYLEDGHGAPLGFDDETVYHEACVRLEPGATVVFFTDGLVEQRDKPIQVGLTTLRSVVAKRAATTPADTLCDEIVAACVADNTDDDVCVVALRALY